MMSHNRAFAIAAIVMLAFLVPHCAVACGTALRHGLDPAVVSEESAIIVWNADTKTESFIPSATFQTSADDSVSSFQPPRHRR